MITILLAAGATPELRDLEGQTPLDWACQNGHETDKAPPRVSQASKERYQ
jgi:ankyrin repeat protein